MESLEIKKKVFSNKRQLDKLVNLMEKNPHIAKSICKKNEAESYWKKFALELNSLGPPTKSPEKWAKVWIDLKAKLRKKLILNKKEISSTGGGSNNINTLSAIDERICEFLNMNQSIDPPGCEFGKPINIEVNNEAQEAASESIDIRDEITVADCEEEINTAGNVAPNRCVKINTVKEKLKLLEHHSKDFTNLSKDVQELKNQIKGISEYTKKMYYIQKDNYHIQKQLLHVKEKKLKIYEDEIKKKQQDRTTKLKLKVELIELKKLENSVLNQLK